jgi:hypothetical protein
MIKDRVRMLKISAAALYAFSLPGMHPRFFLAWLIKLTLLFPRNPQYRRRQGWLVQDDEETALILGI